MMGQRIMMAAVLAMGLGGPGAAVPAVAQDLPLVHYTEDESAIELALRDYLASSRDWDFETREFTPDDVYIVRTFPLDGLPVDVNIDVLSDGPTGARIIRISGWLATGLTPGHSQRETALEALNTGLHTALGPSIYLDEDGDFTYEWLITIPDHDTPVHMGQVAAAIDQLLAGLSHTFLPALQDAGIVLQ